MKEDSWINMSLKEKMIKSYLWLGSTKLVGQTFSWVVTIVLARLLTPEDYGLVAMSAVLISLFASINEFGLGSAVIQKSDVSDEEINTVFWFCLLGGIGFYLVLFLIAPWVSSFFDEQALLEIVRLLGFTLIISSLGIVPLNMLKKKVWFHKIAKCDLIAAVTAGICSLTLALLGWGVWALVWGTLTLTTIQCILYWYFFPWVGYGRISWIKSSNLIRFGAYVTGSRLLYYWNNSVDSFIIGKLLGAQFLGYYSMAMQIAMIPVEKISALINQINFPVYSELKHNKEHSKHYLLRQTRFISFLSFPVFGGLAAIAPYAVTMILGAKWQPITLPLQLLCILGLVRSIGVLIPPLLNALGEVKFTFACTLITTAVLPIAFLIGAKIYGLLGLVIALIVFYPLLYLPPYWKAFRLLNISSKEYFSCLRGPIMLSCSIFIIIKLLENIFLSLGLKEDLPFFIVLLLLSGVISIGVIMVLFKNFISDLKDIWASIGLKASK